MQSVIGKIKNNRCKMKIETTNGKMKIMSMIGKSKTMIGKIQNNDW